MMEPAKSPNRWVVGIKIDSIIFDLDPNIFDLDPKNYIRFYN